MSGKGILTVDLINLKRELDRYPEVLRFFYSQSEQSRQEALDRLLDYQLTLFYSPFYSLDSASDPAFDSALKSINVGAVAALLKNTRCINTIIKARDTVSSTIWWTNFFCFYTPLVFYYYFFNYQSIQHHIQQLTAYQSKLNLLCDSIFTGALVTGDLHLVKKLTPKKIAVYHVELALKSGRQETIDYLRSCFIHSRSTLRHYNVLPIVGGYGDASLYQDILKAVDRDYLLHKNYLLTSVLPHALGDIFVSIFNRYQEKMEHLNEHELFDLLKIPINQNNLEAIHYLHSLGYYAHNVTAYLKFAAQHADRQTFEVLCSFAHETTEEELAQCIAIAMQHKNLDIVRFLVQDSPCRLPSGLNTIEDWFENDANENFSDYFLHLILYHSPRQLNHFVSLYAGRLQQDFQNNDLYYFSSYMTRALSNNGRNEMTATLNNYLALPYLGPIINAHLIKICKRAILHEYVSLLNTIFEEEFLPPNIFARQTDGSYSSSILPIIRVLEVGYQVAQGAVKKTEALDAITQRLMTIPGIIEYVSDHQADFGELFFNRFVDTTIASWHAAQLFLSNEGVLMQARYFLRNIRTRYPTQDCYPVSESVSYFLGDYYVHQMESELSRNIIVELRQREEAEHDDLVRRQAEVFRLREAVQQAELRLLRVVVQQESLTISTIGASFTHTLSDNEQSRMAALTVAEQLGVQALEKAYHEFIQDEDTIEKEFKGFEAALIERYQKYPATAYIRGKLLPLPLDPLKALDYQFWQNPTSWDGMKRTDDPFDSPFTQEELRDIQKAYFSHPVHTVLRYISPHNPLINQEAGFLSRSQGYPSSTYHMYKKELVLYWHATTDEARPPLNSEEVSEEHRIKVEHRIERFLANVAELARSHNWEDHPNRFETTASLGRDVYFKPLSELLDKQDCYGWDEDKLCYIHLSGEQEVIDLIYPQIFTNYLRPMAKKQKDKIHLSALQLENYITHNTSNQHQPDIEEIKRLVDGKLQKWLEEYDDLGPDMPSCASGVENSLARSVEYHPILAEYPILDGDRLGQIIREEVKAYYQTLINNENIAQFLQAITKISEAANCSAESEELTELVDALKFLEIPEPIKHVIENKLKQHYKESFHSFKQAFDGWFKIGGANLAACHGIRFAAELNGAVKDFQAKTLSVVSNHSIFLKAVEEHKEPDRSYTQHKTVCDSA
ncbi:MAG: hypothetical protein Q8R24_02570 [Legionellaceae bacterium]|nr:hypothetical protein [Legionellaceae bacterium]